MADDEVKDKSSSGSPLDGVNKTYILGGLAVLLAGGLGLAYFFSWVSDQLIGLLIAGAFTIILAVLALKVAFETSKTGLRNLLVVYVLLFAAVALYPAKDALHLGHPTASATLTETQSLSLPSGGAYRVLVSGHLSEGRDASIKYRIKAGDEAVDGELKREYLTRRARRGASIQVPEDHDLEAHEMSISNTPPAIVLESVTTGHEVLVQAFRTVPMPIVWVAMALVLILGTFLEVKLASNGSVVMTGASAVCFGLVIKTANPSAMALASLWGALLAAGGGAIAGSVLGAIGRKVFTAPEPTRKGKRSDEDKSEKSKDKPDKKQKGD